MEQTTGRDPQWLRGVLPLLVLAILERGETYGYDLARQLDEAGLGHIKGGTLYPVLGRLETTGLVDVRWDGSTGPGPARKYYRLNAAGRNELARSASAWLGFARRVEDVLAEAVEEALDDTK
ncbi:MAG: PadR family transcriptional regulator [Actinomycetes bacterium]|nr:PadR family transcriptional regulator [Acidimicrobiia bacterium]